MSVDKLVDSTQLNTDLTSVANAIRAKSGGSSQLAFPSGFVSEIGNIPSGETVYVAPYYGIQYTENVETPADATYGWTGSAFRNATHLKSFIAHKGPVNGYQYGGTWANCSALENVVLEITDVPNGGNVNPRPFENDTALKTVQLGSIGHPVTDLTKISNPIFRGCTQSGLTITIFVNAADLASIPTAVTQNSPFGATNATIVYKSSVDGSVLT